MSVIALVPSAAVAVSGLGVALKGVVAGELPAGKVTTVVVDLDGVVYLDTEGIPGAAHALTVLSDAGLDVLFATNNSTKTPATAALHIEQRTGFSASSESVVTSAQAAAAYLAGRHKTALVVGAGAIADALADVGVATTTQWPEADAVVVGLDRDLSYERLVDATHAVRRRGAALVATNGDATYPTPDGLVPGGGAMVAALERATGQRAVVTGKPHAPMRELIEARASGGILMVGDRLETDIAFAGDDWLSALVLTGVTKEPPGSDDDIQPSVVLNGLVDLPLALGL